METVALAEKLSILKLTNDLGVDFWTNVRWETSNKRKIIFDGLAVQDDRVHAVEVKLFRNEYISPSRLERVLLESELIVY
jgi:hypothetical protein